MKNESISRRSFLKKTAATAAVATVASSPLENALAAQSTALSAAPGNKWPGRVVVNFNKNAVVLNGTSATVQPDAVKKMVDDSIKLLTGESTIGAAWKAIFPSTLTAQSKIAIKVPLGCAAKDVAPHWSSVKAMIDGLLQMDINGSKLQAANITVYDMRCSNNLQSYGYTTANLGNGVKIVFDSEGSGYSDGANGKQYAKSLNGANFLINAFRPGGHGNYVEGFTLGFKNHYGTYPVDHGGNSAKGYLRDINCKGAVFNKNVLSVCVGIFGAKEASGSPGSPAISYYKYVRTLDSSISNANEVYPPCTIIMSTDPVTTEMQCIKMMRLNNNPAKDYSVNGMPQYLKASAGVSGSLTPVYNIGIIDESKMDIRKIINEKNMSTSVKAGKQSMRLSGRTLHVKQMHGANNTLIEYNLPEDITGQDAVIEIYAINGDLVRREVNRIAGVNSQYAWDERDSAGKSVAAGSYIVNLTAGRTRLSSTVSIIR